MIHQNPDKLMHDKPPGNRSAIFPLHPFRALFVSMPGGGKRQACLELIGRHPKPFGTITVMHLDSGTSEYEILGENAKMISEDDLPDASTFDRSKRNLLIIDEINISDKKKQHTRNASIACSITARPTVHSASFARSKTHSHYQSVVGVQWTTGRCGEARTVTS